MSETETIINVVIIAIFAGILTGEIAEQIKLPKHLPLIMVGILLPILEPSIFLNLQIEEFKEIVLVFAELTLILVLYKEGMHLDLKLFRKYLFPILLLAVVATLITTLLVGTMVFVFPIVVDGTTLSISFLGALLVAAIIVPTDPAATFSILSTSKNKIKENVKISIEGESALNDVIAILLVVTLLIPQLQNQNTFLTLNIEI